MRLKKHWFHILLALAQGPAHGAEIRRRVRAETEGSFELYPAMLYGSLEDLMEAGLIRELNEEEVPPGDATSRSRHHELTQRGREALVAEADAYRKAADAALAYLAGGGTGSGAPASGGGRWA